MYSASPLRGTGIFDDLAEHIRIRIHSCHEAGHDDGWIESKVHRHFNLWVIQSGTVKVKKHGRTFVAHAGDAVFFFPFVPYSATNKGNCRFIYTHFSFHLGDHGSILHDFPLSGTVPKQLIESEVQAFKEAFRIYSMHANMSELRLKASFTIVLAKIIEAYGNGSYTGSFDDTVPDNRASQKSFALQPVLQYVESHLHCPVSIKELADEAGLSEKYFIVYFKKALGITPGQYIYQQKMNKARDYLYTGKYTIHDIACLLGYADLYTFSKAFKKYYHVPPSKFQ